MVRGFVLVIVFIVVLVFSVSVHEAAHGWAAYQFGDPTAKELGRITLNPIKHIDLFFSIILPAVLYLTAGFVFGGAKPVPFDPMRFRYGTNVKKAIMWVAAAGPISNFILAVIGLVFAQIALTWELHSLIYAAFFALYQVNLLLGLFNLLPIPPLDGAKVLAGMLPNHLAVKIYQAERYAMLFIMLLIMTPLSRFLFVPYTFIDNHLRALVSVIFGS